MLQINNQIYTFYHILRAFDSRFDTSEVILCLVTVLPYSSLVYF